MDKKFNIGAYGLPKVNFPDAELTLDISFHAKQEASRDKNGIIYLPKTINFTKAEIVEMETNDNDVVTKVVVRLPNDQDSDQVLVVRVPSLKVVTAWINKKNDVHTTLNHIGISVPSQSVKYFFPIQMTT